ncbi:hypothetical protein [Bacillus cereus]|uniref:hypothetical protein n=1 Tax=Bacillus cereus TaxID=1396 RepID=UPI0024071467|nr:hypothetical protein [Bacillus cereus]MDF9528437.1 hypothetical protein [Bacillus cereus]MDG1576403.1 hypothetical protein [Bacillus cereus]
MWRILSNNVLVYFVAVHDCAGSLVYSEQVCQDFFQPLEKYTIEINGEVVNN